MMVFHFIGARDPPKCENDSRLALLARLAGGLSILLWIAVVACGARGPYCVVVGDVSSSRPNARNLDKLGLHSGLDVLQRHRRVDEHDDGQWNEWLDVERRFGRRQFKRRSRGRRAPVDPQHPLRRWFPDGCVG